METLLTLPNLLCLGVMIWSGLMLRNATAKNRHSENREAVAELKRNLQAKQRSAESQIRELETHLLEFDRNITSRVNTTLALLDRLIAEADREIVRLEMQLAEKQTNDSASLSAEQPPNRRAA